MLKKISIKNFQSHKDTEFELVEGVNVFSGNSDCGKSAIMRALTWNIQNNLQGDFFVSNWAFDKKRKQKDSCEVTIDNCTRCKGDFNGYVLDGVKYEALRGNVPEQIVKYYNLSEVNIQSQFDGPFMLSNTPGENSRYINELVNLTDIDVALSWVGSEQRECNSCIKRDTEELNNLNNRLKDPVELMRINEHIAAADSLSINIDNIEGKIDRGNKSVQDYKNCRRFDTEELERLTYRIGGICDKGNALRQRVRELEEQLEQYHKYNGKILSADISLNKLSRLNNLAKELTELYTSVADQLEECRKLEQARIKCAETEKDVLAKMEGMVCPTCGRIYRIGDKC